MKNLCCLLIALVLAGSTLHATASRQRRSLGHSIRAVRPLRASPGRARSIRSPIRARSSSRSSRHRLNRTTNSFTSRNTQSRRRHRSGHHGRSFDRGFGGQGFNGGGYGWDDGYGFDVGVGWSSWGGLNMWANGNFGDEFYYPGGWYPGYLYPWYGYPLYSYPYPISYNRGSYTYDGSNLRSLDIGATNYRKEAKRCRHYAPLREWCS